MLHNWAASENLRMSPLQMHCIRWNQLAFAFEGFWCFEMANVFMHVVFVLNARVIGNVRQPHFDFVFNECKSHDWQDFVLICMSISCPRIVSIQTTQHSECRRSCVCCLTITVPYLCIVDTFMLDFNDGERKTDLVLVVLACRLITTFRWTVVKIMIGIQDVEGEILERLIQKSRRLRQAFIYWYREVDIRLWRSKDFFCWTVPVASSFIS